MACKLRRWFCKERSYGGTIVYGITNYPPQYSPKLLICIVALVSFVLFLYRIFKICYLQKITVLPIVLILYSANVPYWWFKRDFLIMVLVSYMFWFFAKYLSKKRLKDIVISLTLLTIIILTHEATCFFTSPLMMVVFYFNENSKWLNKEKIRSLLCLFIVPVIVMGLSFLMKGTQDTACAIWESWIPVFERYPESNVLPEMGIAVAWIGRSALDAFSFHLEENFQYREGLLYILWNVISLFAMFYATFHITANNPYINMKKGMIEKYSIDWNAGNILLFQFVCMIFMFTILSCDFSRTILYGVSSTLFMDYAIDRNRVKLFRPRGLKNITEEYFSKHHLLQSYWIYLVIAMLYPMRVVSHIHIPTDCLIFKLINIDRILDIL